jgi:hypothetical protein
MKSSNSGSNTLTNSVTNISKFGFWIICEEKEYFIAFANYPAFKNASVASNYNFINPSPRQLFLPDIDVDIEIDALDKPEGYPLIFK